MKRITLFLFALLIGSMAFAQFPGGPPPGGGHPGGGPGGRPGQRPGGSPGNMERMDSKTQTIKQKKNVKPGDGFTVVGTLRDSVSKDALVYVNVAILAREDSSLVKGGSTDFDGQFEIKDVPAGEYFIRISYVGYQRVFRPITVENNTALGTLLLKPGALLIEGVTITADRPLYALDGEKLIYNVEDDPSVQSGTTSDALQNAPGVEVDIEGNITLRGVSSVEIWINDKPSKLTSENLKTYLETLPANALARIETITNPSAKYATSADAVINIVTSAHIKKNHFISFGVNGGTQPSFSPWLSYMWANEKVSFNLFASGRYSTTQNDGWSHTTRREANALGNYDTLEVDTDSSWSESQRLGGNVHLNFSYEIDSSADFDLHAGIFSNWNYGLDSSMSIRQQFYNNSTLSYNDITRQPWNGNMFGMFGGTFTKKFDQQGHNLRVFLNGHFDRDASSNEFTRTFLSGNGVDEDKVNNNLSHSINIDLNGRYTKPISENDELSFGLGYSFDNEVQNSNPIFRLASGIDSTDYLRQYDYTRLSNGADADVNWTHRIGNFTIELGLGGNFNNVHYAYSILPDAPANYFALLTDTNAVSYFALTPSIHLSYRTESMHNWKLNYTLRVSSPSASNLTTRRSYSQDSYRIGNPSLLQAYTHNAEAGWSKFFSSMGNVGLEAYTRISQNEINSLSDNEYDELLNRMVQYSKPHNVGNSYRYGLSTNLMIRPSGFFNVRLYGNFYYAGYHYEYERPGMAEMQVADNGKFSYSLRLNTWVKLWNKYQVFASMNYTSSTLSLYQENKPRYWFNCGVRADFFKRKMSAFINVQDLFNWGKTIGGGSNNTNPFLLIESNTRTLNSRYISAGITFRFGKMELERNAQSGIEETGTSTTGTSF